MPPKSRPTVRSLARELGLSPTTVSDALRQQPRVNPTTRDRVLKAASAAGYQFNPLVSSVLSEVRRTRVSTFRGVLATVGAEELDRVPFHGRYWQALRDGAAARAGELGFKIEHFIIKREGITVSRLNQILHTMNIRGVLIMPTWNQPEYEQLNWSEYAGVYADYLIEHPGLHSVCPDHPRAMLLALRRLRELGYERPGLVLLNQESKRLEHRWLATFLTYLHTHPEQRAAAPLLLDSMDETAFADWFRREAPDVVLGHRAQIIDWMQALGARVPETHGFCCLNVGLNARPCTGVDLRPYHIGAHAIEVVISKIQHNLYGVPELPCNTTVPAQWCEGPTLRKRKARRKGSKAAPSKT